MESVRKTSVAVFIEKYVRDALSKDASARMEIEANAVPTAVDLSVRVCYSAANSCDDIPAHTRRRLNVNALDSRQMFIMLFQKINGIDVALMCMSVVEFSEKSCGVNCRLAHVEYIDSADFFQPAGVRSASGESLRTLAYKSVFLGYIASAKERVRAFVVATHRRLLF